MIVAAWFAISSLIILFGLGFASLTIYHHWQQRKQNVELRKPQ